MNEYAEMPAKLAGSFCIDKCESHRHISPTRSVNKTLQLICSSVSFSLYKNTMENQLSFFFLFDMILSDKIPRLIRPEIPTRTFFIEFGGKC